MRSFTLFFGIFLLSFQVNFGTVQTLEASENQAALSAGKSSLVILGKVHDYSLTKSRSLTAVVEGHEKAIKRNVSARSAIVIDAVNGETLFARSPDTPRQPASTIKVLTGMIAIKSLKTDDSIAVSRKAASQPSSKIYLNQRKEYVANDLINAVLLSSANDASVAIAEKIAGSEKSFAQMMTLRSKLLGATNTVCKTATGLTARGQKSTARDLASIFRIAMQDTEFATRMKQTKTKTVEGQILRNHNRALWRLKGTQGGKTGYTNAARQTYVGKFKRGGDEIIVAILGSESMWGDLKHLVEYGFSQKLLNQELTAKKKSTMSKQPLVANLSHLQ